MEKAIAYKVVARFKLRKGMKKKVLVDKKHSIMKNSRVNVATHARKFSQWWHSEPQEIAEKGDDTKVTFYLILYLDSLWPSTWILRYTEKYY